MPEDVQIKQLPAQNVLLIRKRVTTATIGEAMGAAFDTLMRHATATGAQFAGPPCVLYPQMPDGEFEIDVCAPVAPGAAAGQDVELQELPASEAATLMHQGPYDAVGPSWQVLLQWVAASGRPISGPMREVYLNEPGTVAPEELLTELSVPLG